MSYKNEKRYISKWKLEERRIIIDVTNIGILLTVTCYTGFLYIIYIL